MLALVILLFYGGHIALEAERNHQATRLVIWAVDRFVTGNHRWPSSWEEIEGQIEQVTDTYDPADVRRRVVVRFDVNLEDLASERWDTFTAIETRDPAYSYRGANEDLLKTIRGIAGH